MILCKCRHPSALHVNGDSGEECRPSCGCREFRLDARSLLQDEPGTATANGWLP